MVHNAKAQCCLYRNRYQIQLRTSNYTIGIPNVPIDFQLGAPFALGACSRNNRLSVVVYVRVHLLWKIFNWTKSNTTLDSWINSIKYFWVSTWNVTLFDRIHARKHRAVSMAFILSFNFPSRLMLPTSLKIVCRQINCLLFLFFMVSRSSVRNVILCFGYTHWWQRRRKSLQALAKGQLVYAEMQSIIRGENSLRVTPIKITDSQVSVFRDTSDGEYRTCTWFHNNY